MLKNAKLGTKIVLGFSCILTIAIALGGVAVYQMLSANKSSKTLSEQLLPEMGLSAFNADTTHWHVSLAILASPTASSPPGCRTLHALWLHVAPLNAAQSYVAHLFGSPAKLAPTGRCRTRSFFVDEPF